MSIDSKIICPEFDFGCFSGSRLVPAFNAQAISAAAVQDLFSFAGQVAASSGSKVIIDLVSPYRPAEDVSSGLPVVSLGGPVGGIPRRGFIVWDWSVPATEDQEREVVATLEGPSLFLVSDTLATSADLRPQMAFLRTACRALEGSRVLVCTDVQAEHALRSWNRKELTNLFEASGFKPLEMDEGKTISGSLAMLFEWGGDEAYDRLLHEQEIIPQGLSAFDWPELIVTFDHNPDSLANDVAAYVDLLNRERKGRSAVLVLGDYDELDRERIRKNGWLLPENILQWPIYSKIRGVDLAKACIDHLLYLATSLRRITFVDRGASCVRAVQAVRAGLIRRDVSFRAVCLESSVYLESIYEAWMDSDSLELATLEKIAIEQADEIVFPTRYLKEFYLKRGYNVSHAEIERPEISSELQQVSAPEPIQNLIFIGEHPTRHGFSDFVATCELTVKSDKGLRLRKVTLIAPDSNRTAFPKNFVGQLKSLGLDVEEAFFSRSSLRDFLVQAASNSLVIAPYASEGHSLVLVDAVASGCLVAGYGSGGIPECFRSPYVEAAFSGPTPLALSKCVLGLLSRSPEDRHSLVRSAVTPPEKKRRESPGRSASASFPRTADATVAVPVFETSPSYVMDLCQALNRQLLMPREILLVDDASSAPYADRLERLIQDHLRVPYRIVRHERNRGLAGARNTALAECQTEFLLNVDSDDIPLPNFVSDICRALALNGNAAAAIPYLEWFDDGSDWNRFSLERKRYRALGEGIAPALRSNVLGHANSGVRVAAVRKVGGWDSSSKAQWEDWQLYLALVSHGMELRIVPREAVLYRVRGGSMSNTYKTFIAMDRLPKSLSQVSLFDAYRLQAVVRDLERKESSLGSAEEQLAETRSRLEAAERERSAALRELRDLEHRLQEERAKNGTISSSRKSVPKLFQWWRSDGGSRNS